MSANTSIEWTDRTWNPVTGCDKISPGCKHCYAETIAKRLWATQYRPVLAATGKSLDTISTSHHEDYLANGLARPRRFTDVWTHDDRLLEPLSWRKPSRIFVNSMSDLFHESVPDEFIDRVFAVMALAPQHTFQILTKRSERMRDYLLGRTEGDRCTADVYQATYTVVEDNNAGSRVSDGPWPLPNVWLGVSCEDQQHADARIPHLLQTPASLRFVSAEPLIGPIDFLSMTTDPPNSGFALTDGFGRCDGETPPLLHWVIVGGESGPGARTFDLAWARSIIQQCWAADVPCFVKQLGARPVTDGDARHPGKFPLDQANRKGGDITEWPVDLRVREYPRVEASA